MQEQSKIAGMAAAVPGKPAVQAKPKAVNSIHCTAQKAGTSQSMAERSGKAERNNGTRREPDSGKKSCAKTERNPARKDAVPGAGRTDALKRRARMQAAMMQNKAWTEKLNTGIPCPSVQSSYSIGRTILSFVSTESGKTERASSKRRFKSESV